MASLVAQVLGIAHSLDRAGIEWALGGALALAYATEEPRGTPIDLFFAAAPFHAEVARRVRRVPFAGHEVKVLCAEDLAVFKAMFDRPKDWVDIDEMANSGALDRTVAARRLESLLGPGDPRVGRLADGL